MQPTACISPGCCSDENADDFSCHDINKIRAKDYVIGQLVLPCDTLMAHQTQLGQLNLCNVLQFSISI